MGRGEGGQTIRRRFENLTNPLFKFFGRRFGKSHNQDIADFKIGPFKHQAQKEILNRIGLAGTGCGFNQNPAPIKRVVENIVLAEWSKRGHIV